MHVQRVQFPGGRFTFRIVGAGDGRRGAAIFLAMPERRIFNWNQSSRPDQPDRIIVKLVRYNTSRGIFRLFEQ